MKMLTFCLMVILITTFTNLLFSESHPKLQLQGLTTTYNLLEEGNVFYKDPENNTLLIDFKEVKEKLIIIQVTNNQSIILEDSVADLADDSIYEIDLNTFSQGDYTITLTTVNQRTIVENFSIKKLEKKAERK